MTEGAMSEEVMRVGLLVEAAQAQQRLGQESLERLAAHTRDLDMIVRDEIRRSVAEALASVAGESRRAAQSLQSLRRAANLRVALWTVSIAAVCSGVAIGEAWWILPSPREIATVRARRDAMVAEIERLQQRGGSADFRRCGVGRRLCVRVDRSAPAYGAGADYLIIKGY
jgi:hypothetical protein